MKAKTPEPLKRVRLWKTLMRLSQWCALAFLAGSIYFFRSAQYRYGWALAAIAVIVGALLALPAAFAYRRQWTQQSIEAGYGQHAEETELTDQADMLPEQFELLCLFPIDMSAFRDFDVQREIRLTCRERTVRILQLTVPARIRGLEALVDGCLIQMNMPRAPVSRLMLTGNAFGRADTLTAWYRKNLRLLPAMFSVQNQMQAYSDGSEPDPRTIGQLHRITEKRSRDIVLSLSGRELNIFIRNAVPVTKAPIGPGRLTAQKLARLGIPEIPAILDFAFDTEALRAGTIVDFDEEGEKKQAGLQTVHNTDESAFRRPGDEA